MNPSDPHRPPLRCLVTGGAGFLGSHLTERWLHLGHEVVALDNFDSGDARNVAHLMDHPRFQLVDHDVRAPFPPLGGRFDRIAHLACPASPPHYQRDPIYTTTTAVLGTLRALERAAADGARMLQASTSEIYGDPQVHPQPESYCGAVNPIGPRACYDEGKRVGESLCADFRRMYGVDARIVRIFNTYGPRMHPRDGRVVTNFIVQALRGQPRTLYGDGSQTRSLCYVDDLIDGLCALIEHPTEQGPVNLGNEAEVTMVALAEAVDRAVGVAPARTTCPLPADDPTQRRPDLSRATAVLGFAPQVSLDDGLRNTVAWLRSRLEEEDRCG
jgi:UDP-glucuronate decarboxylase